LESSGKENGVALPQAQRGTIMLQKVAVVEAFRELLLCAHRYYRLGSRTSRYPTRRCGAPHVDHSASDMPAMQLSDAAACSKTPFRAASTSSSKRHRVDVRNRPAHTPAGTVGCSRGPPSSSRRLRSAAPGFCAAADDAGSGVDQCVCGTLRAARRMGAGNRAGARTHNDTQSHVSHLLANSFHVQGLILSSVHLAIGVLPQIVLPANPPRTRVNVHARGCDERGRYRGVRRGFCPSARRCR
jgi:hypothetical protein